ncbi:MAG TPA: sigma factor-like helix-turn-helix DNA-binding protein [Candidatus Limnocylindrales bacterium]
MDEEHFDRLYPSLLVELRSLCQAVGGGYSSEDAAQEALMYARTHLNQLRDDDKLLPWLRRIAARTARRRTTGFPIPRDVGEIDQWATVDLSIDEKAALSTLSDRQRVVVTLVYLLGYTEREAAGILGLQRGTIAATLWQSRRRLARALVGYGRT